IYYYMFEQAFGALHVGYAAALGVDMAAVTIGLSLLSFRLLRAGALSYYCTDASAPRGRPIAVRQRPSPADRGGRAVRAAGPARGRDNLSVRLAARDVAEEHRDRRLVSAGADSPSAHPGQLRGDLGDDAARPLLRQHGLHHRGGHRAD